MCVDYAFFKGCPPAIVGEMCTFHVFAFVFENFDLTTFVWSIFLDDLPFLFRLAAQNVNQRLRPLGLGGSTESARGLLLLLHHYQSINNTCFRSPCLRLVPRWSIRAMWHRHEGGARLAAAYERGAEQLQQSLTITVSGWGNGTVGRRKARMMLSSSWYHQLKLVMTELTKQHSVCSKKGLSVVSVFREIIINQGFFSLFLINIFCIVLICSATTCRLASLTIRFLFRDYSFLFVCLEKPWQTGGKWCWYFVSFQNRILRPTTNERLLVQMEIMIGAGKTPEKGDACSKTTSHRYQHLGHAFICTLRHAHTHTAEAVDCICPSSSGSLVATPAASPPPVRFDSRGRIHHLLGSLGASQLLPRGLTGERSWEALGWSLPSFSSSCVGDRQRCVADVRVWGQQKVRLISTSAMFVIPPFPGRKKTTPWSDSQLNT